MDNALLSAITKLVSTTLAIDLAGQAQPLPRPAPMDAATSATVTGAEKSRWEPSGSVI